MPKLEDIELFKSKINSLGNEEHILAEKGEKIVDISPPEQGVPDDISALLNDIADVTEPSGDIMPETDHDEDFAESPRDIFEAEPGEVPESEAGDFDSLGSISDLGSMFEDTEPEDESSLMPDELVGEPLSDELPEDFEAEDEGSADDFALPEDFEAEDEGTAGDFELPEDFEAEDEGSADDFALPEDFEAEDEGTAGDFELPEDFEAEDEGSAGDFELPEDSEAGDEGSADDFELPEDFTAEDEGSADDFALPEDFEAEDEGSADDFALPEDFEAEDEGAADDFELPEDLGTEESGDFDISGLEDEFSSEPEVVEDEPSLTSGDMTGLDESFEMPEDIESETESVSEPVDEFEDSYAGEAAESDENFDLGSLEDISLEDELEIDTDKELSGEDDFGDLEDLGTLEDTVPGESAAPDSDSEEFSLEDLGEEYSSLEEIEEIEEDEISPDEEERREPSYELSEKTEEESEFSIDRDKLDRVTETLNRLPRNLKFIIEDLIGNKGLSGRRLDNLVEKLASGSSVREIASAAEKIVGRKIRIPSQYERKTWEELEEEKQTFSYILRHQILPYAGKIALFSVVLFFAVFVIKKQVYDPLYSSYLYEKGYENLENENYKESDRLFNRASRLKPFRKQFYRYAEGYIGKREYDRADQKYREMLGAALSSEREKGRKERQRGYFPEDKKGFLDYAALKTFYQGEYAESDRILEDYISQKGNKWDYDALLDKIDNFLNWGEIDRSQFDSAGYVLNDSLSKFGNKPELFFRKMAYYLHSGRIDSIEKKALSDIENGDSKSVDVRKYYSMLGEFRSYVENVKEKYADSYMISDFYRYMVDHDNLEGIEERLISVSNRDKNLIEPHYQLSRYWNRMEKKDLEKRALETIESLLETTDSSYMRDNYPHSYNYAAAQRNRIDILTHNRLGKFSYQDDEILDAQRYYKKAVDRFEKYSPLPGERSSYGHIYEDLGDIYYYNAGRYNEALKYYGKAFSTGYENNNLDYKIGFINYKNRNYSSAAEKFYDITLKERENEAALFAFANASYNYGVYSPAKAYYDRVIEKMEYWRDHEKVFNIEKRRDQQEILEKLMQVYNNQGVTLFQLSLKNRNQDYYSKSLVYLSKSSELYDTLMRDPVTMDKTLTKPLAQLNMKWILLNSGWKNMNYEKSVIPYSSDNMSLDSPVIYNSIDHDLFGRVSTSLK